MSTTATVNHSEKFMLGEKHDIMTLGEEELLLPLYTQYQCEEATRSLHESGSVWRRIAPLLFELAITIMLAVTFAMVILDHMRANEVVFSVAWESKSTCSQQSANTSALWPFNIRGALDTVGILNKNLPGAETVCRIVHKAISVRAR
jgi:hypothetical protein